MATSVRPMLTAYVPRPCVQCQRHIPDARALTRHTPVHHARAPNPHAPVKPRESALIPFCNVLLPRGQVRLRLATFLGYRPLSQTNTSLFCTLCPHSCAPGKSFFPVGHPSRNCSRPSTLNLGVLLRLDSRKKLQLIDMSILLILLSLGLGCHTTHPKIGFNPI